MAIAYYIPDQAKLAEKHKPKVVKNIKIPLNDYTLSNNSCWELMAQVFCYALRYHYLTAGNGVLQISVEFTHELPSQHQPSSSPDNPSASESMMTDQDDDNIVGGKKN